MKLMSTCGIALAMAAAICPSLLTAQQTTGTPGSPSATTTIDGRYLPSPPQPFTGVINLDAQQSTPAWPARDRAAQGRAERPAHHDR